jgi:hypothetical protein
VTGVYGQGDSAETGLDSGRRLSTAWWRGAAPANSVVGEQRYNGSGGRTTSERECEEMRVSSGRGEREREIDTFIYRGRGEERAPWGRGERSVVLQDH